MERSLEQRYAIKFCVRLGKNATETFQMLQEADIKDTVKFHHDNAPSHTAFIVTNFLTWSNIPLVPQPPYSPDLAPCDFFLFPRLKRAERKALGVRGKHSKAGYNVPKQHSRRGISGCLPGMADTSPQVY
ncbi:PREDICTED: uncharacterized protein LOC105561422 [Vollenhovia emeryi]|uniref:uncharacterized protein LOC105561422 n=1 Tax=Vollenhovia emeryi TaxID=411798 RepID=UPI0005F546C6|nr:PREDICTED: uncharacterized protein LOC105561422 [Vollenhovia emeryi]